MQHLIIQQNSFVQATLYSLLLIFFSGMTLGAPNFIYFQFWALFIIGEPNWDNFNPLKKYGENIIVMGLITLPQGMKLYYYSGN